VSVLFVGFLFYFASIYIKKLTPENLFATYCVAVTAVIYCISVLLIICIIKTFWGRVRPRDMQNLSEFSPWFLPQGITGNHSFPSGHTSNATVLAVITMFAPLTEKKWKKFSLYAISAIWIVFMAITRIVCGAHFASDTLFAIAISLTLLQVSKNLSGRFISKNLA
ncbi:MAG: phosphatase PAP2 family protein, partial [Oscillospiraceae bacterium]